MSKIKYCKNCIKHEAVKKAKRMLTKIDQQHGGLFGEFYCSVQFTGVEEIDRREIKSCVEKHLNELKKKIEKEILKNQKFINADYNEDFEEGFYTKPFYDELAIIDKLKDLYYHIEREYPALKKIKSNSFKFTKSDNEAKYNEVVNYFKNNHVYGFLQEWFAVLEDNSIRKLYPYTFSKHDLCQAKEVYAEYVPTEN